MVGSALQKMPAVTGGSSQTLQEILSFKINQLKGSTYANVTENMNTPKRDQCLVMMCEKVLNLNHYTNAFLAFVKPENITFVSKVSRNKIQTYLTDKNLVEKITEKQDIFMIKDNYLF